MRLVVRNSFARQSIYAERIPFTRKGWPPPAYGYTSMDSARFAAPVRKDEVA